jgi:hypothetical protein
MVLHGSVVENQQIPLGNPNAQYPDPTTVPDPHNRIPLKGRADSNQTQGPLTGNASNNSAHVIASFQGRVTYVDRTGKSQTQTVTLKANVKRVNVQVTSMQLKGAGAIRTVTGSVEHWQGTSALVFRITSIRDLRDYTYLVDVALPQVH